MAVVGGNRLHHVEGKGDAMFAAIDDVLSALEFCIALGENKRCGGER